MGMVKTLLTSLAIPNLVIKAILILTVLIFTNFLVQYLKIVLVKFRKKANMMPALMTFTSEMMRLVLWGVAFMICLSILGFSEIALILGGSIAVVSLVFAKSISNVVEDLVVGIFLIFDEDIRVGSKVRYKTITGTIESLGIRKTKVRDARNNLHIIPNKVFDTEVVIISEPGAGSDPRKK